MGRIGRVVRDCAFAVGFSLLMIGAAYVVGGAVFAATGSDTLASAVFVALIILCPSGHVLFLEGGREAREAGE